MEHSQVRLSLLGGFSAAATGFAPSALRISSQKGKALLAYLAMQPGYRGGREQLSGLLWGDRPNAQARQSLRQCLLFLRRDIDPFHSRLFVLDNESVALDPQHFKADAPDFVKFAEQPAGAGMVAAAELYAGDFLAGFEVGSEPFDQWVREQRARLDVLASRVFPAAIEQQEAAGNHAASIALAERFVRIDPLREEAQRLLLQLYARHCGRDVALTHAKTFVSMFRRELGADPAKETLALIDGLRHETPALGIPPIGEVVTAASLAPLEIEAPRTPEWRLAPVRRAIPAYVVAAAVLLLPALALLWLSPDRSLFTSPDPSSITSGAAIPELGPAPAWASPVIATPAGIDSDALAGEGIRALVVLPFASEEGSEPARLLADRITDDLINDLSRISSIRVIARQTSRLYGGEAIDVAEIGKELGVHYVVEGSVRIEGSMLRVNVALVEPATRLQVWADRFERDSTERGAVQDEVTRGLARSLQVNLITSDHGRPRRGEATDRSRAALLAKGWGAIFRSQNTGTLSGADKFFTAVLERDDDNFSALVGLAAFHINSVTMMFVPEREPALSEAERLLLRAVEIDPDSHAAHYFLGVLRRVRGELDEALGHFATALKLNPSLAPAYAQIGHVMNRLGRPDEALKHINYAIRLSPKDPVISLWRTFGGIAEINRGNDDLALDWLTDAVSESPRNPLAHFGLAAIHALRGDMVAADRHVAEIKSFAPSHSNESLLQWIVGSNRESDPRFIEGVRVALEVGS